MSRMPKGSNSRESSEGAFRAAASVRCSFKQRFFTRTLYTWEVLNMGCITNSNAGSVAASRSHRA